MTDDQYRKITFDLLEAVAFLKPLTREEYIEEAAMRARRAIARCANAMETLIDGQELDSGEAYYPLRAIDVDPSAN